MAAENSTNTAINNILKHENRKQLFEIVVVLCNISVYCIFEQINEQKILTPNKHIFYF